MLALVVTLERVGRFGIGRIDRVQALVQPRRLRDVAHLRGGHARGAAEHLHAARVGLHQLGATLVHGDEPPPVGLRREDALERRLRDVVLRVEIEHFLVRRGRLAQRPEVLELELAAARVQIGEAIRARLLLLDEQDGRFV